MEASRQKADHWLDHVKTLAVDTYDVEMDHDERGYMINARRSVDGVTGALGFVVDDDDRRNMMFARRLDWAMRHHETWIHPVSENA